MTTLLQSKYIIRSLFLLLFLSLTSVIQAQIPSESMLYDEAYSTLASMLNGETETSFSDAVFIVENAYLNGQLSKERYNLSIKNLADLATEVQKKHTLDYKYKDKAKVEIYGAIYTIMTDTQAVIAQMDTFYHLPYTYDFTDAFGDHLWQNMFVSKLIDTHTGNCHSLPYLYKILAEELGEEAHLALAPNHVYIKQRCEKAGWYNTELTSGSFPIDAWLMASGYVHLDAIRSGIYMKALSDKESIAMCLIDLAMGYERKYPNNDGSFVLECTKLALQHFPNYINALLLAAETKQWQIKQMMAQYNVAQPKNLFAIVKDAETIWQEMEQLYVSIHKLGYRQMPKQMYLDWLVSLKEEREEFTNKKVTRF